MKSISVEQLIIIASTVVASVLLVFILRKLLTLFIKRSSTHLKVNPTNYKFLKNAVSFIIFSTAAIFIIYTIPAFRSLGTTLFAGAGIFAAILGFASQQAFSNIISGIFVVIFKPFSVGDMVDLGENKVGIVEDITLRHTIIRDFQNRRIIIPNSVISGETLVNSHITDEKILRHIDYGISYDSNIDKAIAIIQEEAMKHKNFLDNRSEEDIKNGVAPVSVRLVRFDDSSVVLRAYVWSGNPGLSWDLYCDLNKSVKERFDKEGIEIPFPYRTVVFKNKEG
jgi:small conductance mechanosensitive channel